MILLNRSEKEATMHIQLKDVGIQSQKGYTMKDLWTKEQFPNAKAPAITRNIPPHGVVVL